MTKWIFFILLGCVALARSKGNCDNNPIKVMIDSCPAINKNIHCKKAGYVTKENITSWEDCAKLARADEKWEYWVWHHGNTIPKKFKFQCHLVGDYNGAVVTDTNTIVGDRECMAEETTTPTTTVSTIMPSSILTSPTIDYATSPPSPPATSAATTASIAESTSYSVGAYPGCVEVNKAHMGNNLPGFPNFHEKYDTAQDCWRECKKQEGNGCRFWNWVDIHNPSDRFRGVCYLKRRGVRNPAYIVDYIAGPLGCNPS